MKMKVLLLIDSESGLKENLSEILELAGYHPEVIEEHSNHKEFSNLEGYFVVLDAGLRDKSFAIYERLKSLNGVSPYPLLVLSSDGLPDKEYPKACSFLAMPFSADEFLDQVKTCTQKCIEQGILV